MIWQKRVAVFLWLFLPCALLAEPYDFDTSAFDKKPFSIRGNVELRPSLAVLNRESESYKARYGSNGDPGFLDTYLSRLELFADYRNGPLLFYSSGLGFVQYERHDALLDYDAYPYEAYGRLSFESKSTNVWLGKRIFKWGKGYTFNPTAFAARPKDINDVEAGMEGYWSVSGEFIHAFSGRVSTLALTAAIIPEYETINAGYIGQEGVAGAAQLYLLAYDTDIDFNFYLDQEAEIKAGVGFSRNIFPNCEIHGEAAYVSAHQTTFIVAQNNIEAISGSANNALLGVRYLTKWNTTVITEYIRNGQGFSKDQMNAYFSALQNRNTLTPDVRNFLNIHVEQYMSQFAMRNYVYTKMSQPEPLGILYLTPSVYAVANMDDKSLMAAFEIAYTRFKNISIAGKMMFLHGGSQSEYGSKTKEVQLEFRGRYFF